MAKSKTGGSRAFIRGKLGADVYSIGKDGKGTKQQVVRSLAESVKNPQTEAQMFGRMVMSTVMQGVSAMSTIIDHSFDGVSAGQPSISEFIKRNYQLIAADAKANPASGNSFGLNKYQEKGAKQGAWVVSNGSAVMSDKVKIKTGSLLMPVKNGETLQQAIDNGYIAVGDYWTLVLIDATKGFCYVRVSINESFSLTESISADNAEEAFVIESNVTTSVNTDSDGVIISTPEVTGCNAIIYSKKTADGYSHNNAVMSGATAPTFASNVALPTYPVGSERFLNGGTL